jgi:hypothetical protein
MTGLGTGRTPLSTSHLPPAPRETAHARDVWVSLSVAAVLALSAVMIALWPAEPHARTAPQSEAPALPITGSLADAPAQTGPSGAQNLPTQFTNPFDASEVFEFPPGTTEDAARQAVADILLKRARERRTQLSSVKHVHGHPSASSYLSRATDPDSRRFLLKASSCCGQTP